MAASCRLLRLTPIASTPTLPTQTTSVSPSGENAVLVRLWRLRSCCTLQWLALRVSGRSSRQVHTCFPSCVIRNSLHRWPADLFCAHAVTLTEASIADIVQYRGGLVPNLMSWLLVLFSKEQGTRVRTLGVRGGGSAAGKPGGASDGSSPVQQFHTLRADSLRPRSFKDAVGNSIRKAQQQASDRYSNLPPSVPLCALHRRTLLMQV